MFRYISFYAIWMCYDVKRFIGDDNMKNIFRRSKKEKLKTNNCMKEIDIKIFKMVKERGLK